MTIQAKYLLKQLKKAQMHPDEQVYIDFDKMTVVTVHEVRSPYTEINLKNYSHSIRSTLTYLKELGYIDYNESGYAKVTHTGWNALSTTVQSTVKFTVRDVIIPIIVSVIAAIITTMVLQRI